MDFSERIHELGARFIDLRDHVSTEEATKTSFVLPFLNILGYDTFDPRIVNPEFTADVGTKKGERVDYAIMRDGEPIILIECKTCGSSLDQGKASQLHRYFHATSSRIAILTDGIIYKFFSDLDKPNVMDDRPFMIFDFNKIEEALIPQLKKLASDRFDVATALHAAEDLKYTRQIKQAIANELATPSDDFVRFFASKVYSGQLRANIIEEFRPRIIQASEHHINDVLNQRLRGAMKLNEYEEASQPPVKDAEAPQSEDAGAGITTTQEEIEAYLIVKSILRAHVDPSRIAMRDRQSYCGILLDDNNRKPICRLHFDRKQKQLGIFDAQKNESKVNIDALDDIFNHAELLITTVQNYDAE